MDTVDKIHCSLRILLVAMADNAPRIARDHLGGYAHHEQTGLASKPW